MNKKMVKLSDGREVEVDVDENGNWCYVNWDAIKSMTEEEAAEAYGGLLETFTGRKAAD